MNKAQTTQIASQAATVLITIVISMTGFWMMIGREFVTREEVSKMTETRLELVRDNMNDFEENSRDLQRSIEANDKSINDLRIELVKLESIMTNLSKLLERMETRHDP